MCIQIDICNYMCFVKACVVNNTIPFFPPEKTVVFLNIISVRSQKKKRIFYKKSKTMRNRKKNNNDI